MKNLETEYKWDGNSPRAFARMKRAAEQLARTEKTEKLHLRDIYLDDAEHTLHAQKIVLRLRGCGDKWEATLKTRTEVKNGKAVRKEYTLPLPDAHDFAHAFSALQNKKMWQKVSLKNLRAQFEIRNCRRIFLLEFQGALAELALDNVEILVLGRRVKIKEIELELKKGRAPRLDRLAEQLTRLSGLRAATFSKVRTAESLLSLWGDK